MKIFDRVDPWPSKVNFVDENNVVLGYDVRQACCEYAGWFIAGRLCRRIPEERNFPHDLSGWRFDPSWFREVTGIWTEGRKVRGTGPMVVFRIMKCQDERFIHLFNCHNGYYTHGFELKAGEDVLKSGQI